MCLIATVSADVLLIDHTFYPVVYGLIDDDDWTDEKNWYKANPSLGQTIKIERVREMIQEALDNPAEENVFKQLRLNMWVASLTRFIPEQIYDLGNTPIDMEALKGRDCYGGLDLSSTGDIAASISETCIMPVIIKWRQSSRMSLSKWLNDRYK